MTENSDTQALAGLYTKVAELEGKAFELRLANAQAARGADAAVEKVADTVLEYHDALIRAGLLPAGTPPLRTLGRLRPDGTVGIRFEVAKP